MVNVSNDAQSVASLPYIPVSLLGYSLHPCAGLLSVPGFFVFLALFPVSLLG